MTTTDHRDEPLTVRQYFGGFVCRGILLSERVDHVNRDVRHAMGVPEGAVRSGSSVVVVDGTSRLVAVGVEGDAADELLNPLLRYFTQA